MVFLSYQVIRNWINDPRFLSTMAMTLYKYGQLRRLFLHGVVCKVHFHSQCKWKTKEKKSVCELEYLGEISEIPVFVQGRAAGSEEPLRIEEELQWPAQQV